MIHLRLASKSDIPLIQKLTNEIWPATYRDILKSEQISYMLEMMYSTASLEGQINQPHLLFYIIVIDEQPCGYTSCELNYSTNTAKIHKLYLATSLQGKGYGRKVVSALEKIVAPHQIHYLQLNVNRHNAAVHFYKRIGFDILLEEDIHIGNDFYMNDYVMQKKLTIQ